MAKRKRAKTTVRPAASPPKRNAALSEPVGAARPASLFDEPVAPPDRVQKLAPLGIQRQPGVASLIDIRDPTRGREDLVLSADNLRLLASLAGEFRHGEQIRRHGLAVRSKVLFCGPPGCGKTVTAEAFAHELSLPLVTMRLETVISSFLGETASNLAKVFESVERQPCVLFLDEFDAIARTRAAIHEHNELRRVVNSLLLMIDRFRGRGFVVAATNLEEALDPALWRRFDEVLLFERPNLTQVRQLIRLRTRNFPADFDVCARAEELKGLSYAEIERVCLEAIREAIIRRGKTFTALEFEAALKNERRRHAIRGRIKNRVEDVTS